MLANQNYLIELLLDIFYVNDDFGHTEKEPDTLLIISDPQ